MIKAVIFDMDGVIVDSHPVHKKAWRRFLELQNKEVSEEDLDFIMEGRKREEILRHFLGELTNDELHSFGQQKEQIFREEAVHVRLVEGFLNFLQLLVARPLSLAVASSGSCRRVNEILTSLKLTHYFTVVVTGDDVSRGKPDPSIFALACDRLGVDPSEVLVFEDSVSGVKAAKEAGMICVGVANNGVIPILVAAGADHIIPHFSNLTWDVVEGFLR